MRVHIIKYRLKWLYGCKVSYANNVRFCARAHFPVIDTPSQKMHDDEVSKLEMWLVVEELREHQAMMAWGVIFCVVVPKVGASRGPVNIELTLTSVISDPVEVHVNCL